MASLQPGVALLYRPSDVFDWAVVLKTWTKVSHIEVYVGNGKSVASRNGEGVDEYDVRLDHVAAVLQAPREFDLAKALEWFRTVQGKTKYGWWTLTSFMMLNRNPIAGHMICSEFAAHFYAQGGWPLFAADWPAYRTPPSLFLSTPKLRNDWDDGNLF